MVAKRKTTKTLSKAAKHVRTHADMSNKFGVKVAHHKHTGKKIHFRYTSYAVLYFLLVLTGSTLLFAGNSARATDQVVNGSVTLSGRMKGPVPPNPAVVSAPDNGSRTNTNTTVIRGTCQPGLYIELFRYSTFAGATLCGNSGEFQLSATLRPGQNDFKVRMSDADAQYAPDSAILSIFYDVIKPTTGLTKLPSGGSDANSTIAQNQNNPPNYEPLVVTTSLPRQALPYNKDSKFKYTIIGGLPAYAVLINWDDGSQSDLQSIDKAGDQIATHKFTKSGQHVVTITVSDQLNNRAVVQTIVNVAQDYTGVASVISPNCVVGSADYFSTECYVNSRVAQILDSIWPAFVVATLMTVSFWFGERIVYARYVIRPKH